MNLLQVKLKLRMKRKEFQDCTYVSQLQYEHVVVVVIHSNSDYYPQLLLAMLRPNIFLHMHSGGG